MVRLIITAIIFILLSNPSKCQTGAGAVNSDPYFNPDQGQYDVVSVCNGSWQCNAPYLATTGKTVRNLTVNTSIKNLVLIVAGQSVNSDQGPSAYTATNASAIDNFNIFDGAIYAAGDPQLGSTYITTIGPGLMDYRVADTLITNGKFNRVILVPISVGGSASYAWATYGTNIPPPGNGVPSYAPNSGSLSNRMCTAMKRLAKLGITPSTTNVTFAIDWGQGESEAGLSTTQVQYQQNLTNIINKVESCGFSGRVFVNVETWVNGVYTPVETAQSAIVDNVTYFAGANLDSLGNSYRVDMTHFNDTGMAAAAALKISAWAASGAPF